MIIRALGPHPISVQALIELTGAAPVTVRRDLTELEGQGLLRRVHGGALAVDLRGRPMPYAVRAAENAPGKAAIAAVLASLISDDMSLVLDNGTTMVAAAEALSGRRLTALCLSLRSAMALADAGSATVLTPGGAVAAESLRYSAASCLTALDSFRADVAIMGTCAATAEHGLTVTTHEDAQVKRAIIASASRVVLAATGDKLARTSSFRFGTLTDLDDVVTTSDAPQSTLDAFADANVTVHIAD